MSANPSAIREVIWARDTLETLRGYSRDVRITFGHALDEAQRGGKHRRAKPLKGFAGAGVLEVIERDEGGTYRLIYTVKFHEFVYVLHVFQKKAKKGIVTPRKEIELIKRRLAWAKEHYDTWRQARKKRTRKQ